MLLDQSCFGVMIHISPAHHNVDSRSTRGSSESLDNTKIFVCHCQQVVLLHHPIVAQSDDVSM